MRPTRLSLPCMVVMPPWLTGHDTRLESWGFVFAHSDDNAVYVHLHPHLYLIAMSMQHSLSSSV